MNWRRVLDAIASGGLSERRQGKTHMRIPSVEGSLGYPPDVMAWSALCVCGHRRGRHSQEIDADGFCMVNGCDCGRFQSPGRGQA